MIGGWDSSFSHTIMEAIYQHGTRYTCNHVIQLSRVRSYEACFNESKDKAKNELFHGLEKVVNVYDKDIYSPGNIKTFFRLMYSEDFLQP